jgi:hypothetical protein
LWQRIREAERQPDAARAAFFRALLGIDGIYVHGSTT